MLRMLLLCLPLLCANAAFAQYTLKFTEVTKQAGLYEPLAGMMGHGGAFGDYDNDGLLDLYVGGFCDRPDEKYAPAKGPVPNKLFRNRGDGTFETITDSPVNTYGRTSGAIFADLDNNGTLDLYVANNSKGRTRLQQSPQKEAQVRQADLFKNEGGTFKRVPDKNGAVPEDMLTARNIGVFDYNGDGLLDLLVVEDTFTQSSRTVLLKNLGDLKFKDVTAEMGLPNDMFGLGLAVADINDDTRPDFFVAHSNRLFVSTNGGKYIEASEQNPDFAWETLDGEDWPCGAAFADVNRDGLLDLILTIHYEQARNRLYLNRGVQKGIPRFNDVTSQVGLETVVPQKCPHVELQDFNNDGWLDLYTSAAWLDQKGSVTPLVYQHAGLKGGLPHFVPPRKIAGPMVYYPAGPSGDYDNDGDVDLFLINWFEENHSRLLRNDAQQGNWINVRVAGRTFNRMGIGSQIKVYAAGKLGQGKSLLGFQEITIGYGYASGQAAECHFGLGNVDEVDMAIRLPNGKQIERRGVQVNATLTVEE